MDIVLANNSIHHAIPTKIISREKCTNWKLALSKYNLEKAIDIFQEAASYIQD